MIDPTPNEKSAMGHGGQMGGEYLESIGKTDLLSLTPEEWNTFIESVVTGYCDCLREIAANDSQRLEGMREGVPF